MIDWICGNSGAGKTTLAKKMLKERSYINKPVWLDGDDLRERLGTGFALTEEDRIEHNLRTARLAKLLEDQGFDVIVSVICPYESLRQQVKEICGCRFIYYEFDGDDEIPDKPFEKPVNPDMRIRRPRENEAA